MAASGLAAAVEAHAAPTAMNVYKNAGCGCCEGWIKHLEAAGFRVSAQDVPDLAAYRKKYGVPEELAGCHTGVVQGYVIEGHVPAAEVQRLLKEKPKARGLSVAGMPMGSPGMEGGSDDTYDVRLIKADGASSVYRRYRGMQALG
ncbi:Uncharacterized conserved protein [Noviherbaspirillum humi]|uniref:Uncharacterized conserved protein n=2 Tax=Noviherbaspirillum humi TaxID=1688639 RepID=A0A239CHM0_9BURK|nr:Uncharacterized conserved protein [Noviherbaspirillum humi]